MLQPTDGTHAVATASATSAAIGMPNHPADRHLEGRDLVVGVICITMFLLNAAVGVLDGLVGWAIVSAALIYALYPHASGSMALIGLFTGITVWIVPMLSLIYVGVEVMPAWISLYTIILRVMIRFSPEYARLPSGSYWAAGNLFMIFVVLAIGLSLQALALGEVFFHAAFACSLVNLERLHAASESPVLRLTGVALCLLSILVFSFLFWAGYGRLILSTLGISAVMITVYYGTFRIWVLSFVAVSAALVFIGRVLRFGLSEGIGGLAEDSGATPIILTEMFWDSQVTVFWTEPLWHQWSLLFLNWYPRAWWPEKPIGLNYTLVDAVLGRAGYGEEHSTAVSFLGEQIFLFPNWWIFTTALVISILIFLFRTVAKLAAPYFAPVALLQAWLLSFFWGGMATYGSRIWFTLVPMMAYLVILRILTRPRARPTGSPAFAGRG